jgi:hypothetical protein
MYHHNIITTHDIVSRLSIMAYEQTVHTLRVFNNTDAEHRSPSDVARMDILDCDGSAFILRDFFSLEECQWYIEQAEAFGIKSCGYKHSIRITDRVAAKSQLVANQLFKCLVPFLEPNINLEASINEWPTGICRIFPRRKWYSVGLNEEFRICRYEPGGFFQPHHDGGYDKSDTINRSMHQDFHGISE